MKVNVSINNGAKMHEFKMNTGYRLRDMVALFGEMHVFELAEYALQQKAYKKIRQLLVTGATKAEIDLTMSMWNPFEVRKRDVKTDADELLASLGEM